MADAWSCEAEILAAQSAAEGAPIEVVPRDAILAACADALDAAPCDAALAGPGCARPLGEQGPWAQEGDACGWGADCEPPLDCDENVACSACRRPAAEGEDCSAVACGGGTHCDPATSLCVAPSAAGVSCAEPSDCASGWCNGGTCADRLPLGAPCVAGDVCAGFLACIEGACAERRPAGAACGDDDDCFFSHWCTGGTCTAQDRCGEGAVGQRCEGGFAGGCAEGLFCDEMNPSGRVCQLVTPLGELCTGSPECGVGAFCDFSGGAFVCVTVGAEGAPCTLPSECAVDLTCGGAGTCTTIGENGALCGSNLDCGSGHCDPGGVCGLPPACP